ncbi:MAG: hypothetical protein VW338_14770, partial [Rhodospirillaceae bacterium]
HEGINVLPWIMPRASMLFCSTSGDGNARNQEFFDELHKFYYKVEQIGVGIANRAIFLCTGQKSTSLGETKKPEIEPQVPTPQTTSTAPAKAPRTALASSPRHRPSGWCR